MARKVKCPQCGAKNASDQRRCRVCTAIINTKAPEPGKEPPKDEPTPVEVFDASALEWGMTPKKSFGGGSGLRDRLAGAAPSVPTPPSAPFGAESVAGDVAEPGLAADDPFQSLAPPRTDPLPVEPIGYPSGSMASELFGDPTGGVPGDDELGDAIVIEAVPRHAAEPPPPLDLGTDELFDPNDLVIERGPLPPDET